MRVAGLWAFMLIVSVTLPNVQFCAGVSSESAVLDYACLTGKVLTIANCLSGLYRLTLQTGGTLYGTLK